MQIHPRQHDLVRSQHNAPVRTLDLLNAGFPSRDPETVVLGERATEVSAFGISRGEQRPLVSVHGEAAIYCVKGYVLLHASDADYHLTSGILAYLASEEPHRLEGIEDSVLLTVHLRPGESQIDVEGRKDAVQEASEESFPASDPPSFNPGG